MELLISVSAKTPRITAELLVKKMTGSYHGGMQKVSNVDGIDVLWNYVKVENGKTQVVMTKDEAAGIVANSKFYRFK